MRRGPANRLFFSFAHYIKQVRGKVVSQKRGRAAMKLR
jgi:hypothetical protein